MSRFQFEVATPQDDVDLRSILAATPMDGPIRVSLRREPSFFAAAVVDGSWRQTIVARDRQTRHVVGFGTRSVRQRYVNGKPQPVGYLSNLRLLSQYRSTSLVARGYRFFRQLHQDQRAPMYLTTIAEGNRRAISLLTSRRAGLPDYHFAGRYHTLALSLDAACAFRNGRRPTLKIRRATGADLPDVLQFLRREGPRRQFFPTYTATDFFAATSTFRDLEPGDLWLALDNRELVGTLAIWDQHHYKQAVIEGYQPALHWARPLYNGWAQLAKAPRLPPVGTALQIVTAALPVVRDDDPQILSVLLQAARQHAAARSQHTLLLGFHEKDPLLPFVQRQRHTRYVTRLYIVCWDDGAATHAALDQRCPYLELGCL